MLRRPGTEAHVPREDVSKLWGCHRQSPLSCSHQIGRTVPRTSPYNLNSWAGTHGRRIPQSQIMFWIMGIGCPSLDCLSPMNSTEPCTLSLAQKSLSSLNQSQGFFFCPGLCLVEHASTWDQCPVGLFCSAGPLRLSCSARPLARWQVPNTSGSTLTLASIGLIVTIRVLFVGHSHPVLMYFKLF